MNTAREDSAMSLRRTLLVLVAGIAAVALSPCKQAEAQQPPGRRVALVVGNGGYQNVPRFANPANDARLLANTLQSSGFTLIGGGAQTDQDKSRLERLVQQRP